MEQRKLIQAVWKFFLAGGWFPVLVFVIHLFTFFVVNIYAFWPRADMPLHFLGGLSIAFFVSRSYQLLQGGMAKSNWESVIELVLIISVTATAAVFWEFGEFILDRTFKVGLQVSLLNTMQDLFLGMLGAVAVFVVRLWRLRAGIRVDDLISEISG